MNAATQWDDDRIKARIEAWEPAQGTQIGLGQSTGVVVRVYDHGPADGRAAKPVLLLSSEVRHGTAGVFGDTAEASDYAARIERALLDRERAVEALIHERRDLLPERQAVHWTARDQAKAEAAEANKRAKAHQADAETLGEEARRPEVTVDCPLRGEGWVVLAAPSLTDGTRETNEPRVLVDTRPSEKATAPARDRRRHGKPVSKGEISTLVDEMIAETEAKRLGRDPAQDREAYETVPGSKARKPPRRKGKAADGTPKLPDHVPDAGGLPLRIGSRVEYDDGAGETEGEVLRIVGQDHSGHYRVEVQGEDGEVCERLSGELVRIDRGRDPAEDEPEPDDE